MLFTGCVHHLAGYQTSQAIRKALVPVLSQHIPKGQLITVKVSLAWLHLGDIRCALQAKTPLKLPVGQCCTNIPPPSHTLGVHGRCAQRETRIRSPCYSFEVGQPGLVARPPCWHGLRRKRSISGYVSRCKLCVWKCVAQTCLLLMVLTTTVWGTYVSRLDTILLAGVTKKWGEYD